MNQMISNRSPDAVWDAIESHLMGIKRAAVLEIRNYPQPIAGCDAQIPALWEKRDAIAAELDRLFEARKGQAYDARSVIDAFIANSSFINDDQMQEFRALAKPQMPSAAE